MRSPPDDGPYTTFDNNSLFSPLGMNNSLSPIKVENDLNLATGYEPDGYLGLKKVASLNWGNKTGNGSILSTARDLLKLSRALNENKMLDEESLGILVVPETFNSRRMTMWSGGAPGFSSEFHRYTDENITIIVLSNNYSTVDLPPRTSPPSKLDSEPFEVHSTG